MIRNLEKNSLFLVAVLILIIALASVPAAAWGPYAQAVIAEESAAALGQPKGTGTPVFLNTAVTSYIAFGHGGGG